MRPDPLDEPPFKAQIVPFRRTRKESGTRGSGLGWVVLAVLGCVMWGTVAWLLLF